MQATYRKWPLILSAGNCGERTAPAEGKATPSKRDVSNWKYIIPSCNLLSEQKERYGSVAEHRKTPLMAHETDRRS